jgi:uncharacterized membrane protein YphA (DoxX/SURF4 family)
MESKALVVVSWVFQVVAALILLQTLFFKFTGAEESKYIFTVMGMEPWGRYASGVAELIAAVLLLIPATAPIGAAMAMGVMVGAIGSHLTKLGIVVKDDGGLLFALTVTVFLTSAVVLVLRHGALSVMGKMLAEAVPLPRIG